MSQPDIKRNLREFSDCIQKKKPVRQGNSPLNGHDSDYALNRKEWEEDATDAISHLMEYLTNNIITLKEWLCEVYRAIHITTITSLSNKRINSRVLMTHLICHVG